VYGLNRAKGWFALAVVGFVFRPNENFFPLIQRGALCPCIPRGLRPVASRDGVTVVVYPRPYSAACRCAASADQPHLTKVS
jgi:hypothetical protein